MGYLSHLKYALKIEKYIFIAKNQIAKFDKYMIIYNSENTNMHAFLCLYMYHYRKSTNTTANNLFKTDEDVSAIPLFDNEHRAAK